jgi:hypothetical protein
VANCTEDASSGPSNRLSRFTMHATTLQIGLNSEFVLLETPPSPTRIHNGGAMAFGNDGLLYLATGDAGSSRPNYSQDLRNLYGKIIRLDSNGNVPGSNPFARTTSGTIGVPCRTNQGRPSSVSPSNAVCEEIFAYGFRNPFRLAMDVNTKSKVRFAVGDVVPPTVLMKSPTAGSQFVVGQQLRLKGSAIDSRNVSIPDSKIFWEVRQHHASHFHPFMGKRSGNDFDLFPAPEPDDSIAATNSFLEVILYAVDSDGVTTTISCNVKLKQVWIDIDSSPQGLQILVDEFAVVTPGTITSWENHNLRLDVQDQRSRPVHVLVMVDG